MTEKSNIQQRLSKSPSPDNLYPDLFSAVQKSSVFPDSKTFADAIPKSDPTAIYHDFLKESQEKNFQLAEFVSGNFDLPQTQSNTITTDSARPVRLHIEQLWDLLTRTAKTEPPYSSLISLPNPFVVPGGRFREIYYWDSYFTLLGLSASGRVALIEDMVANFAHLIDQVGHIPNGNRTYYCSRSQPPFFALMIELLAEVKQDQNIFVRFLPQLEKEYAFWMSGSERLHENKTAERRVVAVNGGYLNRYWDDSDSPRPESYLEDLELAAKTNRVATELYRDIRAACESGWDFSCRWFKDENTMESIQTTEILPIDLNAVMYNVEKVLAQAYSLAGQTRQAKELQQRAEQRKHLIQSLFFCEKEKYFVDLLLPDLTPNKTLSLAGAFPLFFELATPSQASQVAERIHKEFLQPGGWVTTLNHSGQQWDAPNGWAPMQWIVYNGLQNYGFNAIAREGAKCWVDNNLMVYQATGKLLEKYNVESPGVIAEGGEYEVQDGFGWTNGVLLCFLDTLGVS